jgi:radical SAM-linked protein
MIRFMDLEARPATIAPPPSTPPTPAVKVRLRFRKNGTLRLLSHHDLMRTFERMLRRAALPFRSSQGFHPKPRLIFALSLPLGVIGREEVAELELDEVLPLDIIRERLIRQAPPGLEILSVQQIGPRIQAQVRRLTYRLAVPQDRLPELQARVATLLASTQCLLERAKPTVRKVDVRPFLSDLRVVPDPDAETQPAFALEMELWLTQTGTARPDELLTLLGIQDLLDMGAVLERTRLELHDEITPDAESALAAAAAANAAASAVENIGLA